MTSKQHILVLYMLRAFLYSCHGCKESYVVVLGKVSLIMLLEFPGILMHLQCMTTKVGIPNSKIDDFPSEEWRVMKLQHGLSDRLDESFMRKP